jgi:hypothetical protein
MCANSFLILHSLYPLLPNCGSLAADYDILTVIACEMRYDGIIVGSTRRTSSRKSDSNGRTILVKKSIFFGQLPNLSEM